jgi:6-phosphogluconolactonase
LGGDLSVVVVDSDDFAVTAADAIARLVAGSVAERGAAHVALAGGSTPRPVYRHLAERHDVSWTKVHIYFGDERAVPPNDGASNYHMAHETLLRHVPIPPGQVHRMEAEREDLEAAAADYASLLPERLDVVLLGLGEDGHTASLFPGSAALAEHDKTVLPVDGPKPPAKRLTIAPGVITGARATLVMAAGRGKAEAVARALEGSYDPVACPAQFARGGIWVLDRPAAARLERDRS